MLFCSGAEAMKALPLAHLRPPTPLQTQEKMVLAHTKIILKVPFVLHSKLFDLIDNPSSTGRGTLQDKIDILYC